MVLKQHYNHHIHLSLLSGDIITDKILEVINIHIIDSSKKIKMKYLGQESINSVQELIRTNNAP